ncbi:MAG: CoA ester lyase [Myxococcales bacterium]|nr:CoA ester lyase [Myxococcales bacterium]MCB9642019.1 CoA ester lyase [Myxococcales bacterium]
MKPPRRSMLFMPGDSLRKIAKAATLEADCIVMDLEDGVALNQKAEARKVIAQAFQEVDFGRREKLIRINPLYTGMTYEDIHATIACQPDGYVIPKVEHPDQLKEIDYILRQLEHQQNYPSQSIGLYAVIESALGIVNVGQIAGATPRLRALMFGAEDLAGDIGAQRTSDGWEVFYARSAVVTAAAAYRLDPIDTVHPDFHDPEGLERECQKARQMGYTGKMAIHPNQVATMNKMFSPSPEEIDRAKRLLQVNQEQQAQGIGAFAFEGKMVDMPMIRHAERILQSAQIAGLLDISASQDQ